MRTTALGGSEDEMTSRQTVSTWSTGHEQSSAGPGVALWRVVGALTPMQAQRFAREIELLTVAIAPKRPDGTASPRVPQLELAHNGLRPIGLHECRHTAVSQMLDAGIPIEKVSKFNGHASITTTIDRYGHLLPGGETDAIALLDGYHR
jgi:hypothetical protein